MMPLYVVSPPWEPLADPAAVLDPPVRVTDAKLCLAGSPGTYGNYLVLDSTVHEAQATRVAEALVERARASAVDAGCRLVLLPYLDERQALWLDGYRSGAGGLGACEKSVLPVIWESFDDYVSWLPKKRRLSVRAERQEFLRSGLTVREERLSDRAAELAPLLAQTERRYGRAITDEEAEFYLTLRAMHLGDNCLTLVLSDAGRPVAFSLTFRCGECWVMSSWGCDYDARPRWAYFNLVFYEPIERAIRAGSKMIDFGVGAPQAKRLRGCGVEQLQTMLIDAAPAPVAQKVVAGR
jgi:predicted N-acyltransferase